MWLETLVFVPDDSKPSPGVSVVVAAAPVRSRAHSCGVVMVLVAGF